MIKKMGPLQGVLKLVPGMGRQLEGLDVDDAQMARVEAIVLSMTPHERRTPHLINGPRRRRIAAGSGTIADVNRLLQARKQMEKMMKRWEGKDARVAARAHRGRRPRSAAGARRAGAPRRSVAAVVRIQSSFSWIPGTITLCTKGEHMAVRMRLTRVGSKKNPIYRVVVADSRSPRRSLHRDRRALQPADRPVDDRPGRRQGQGLARQGRPASDPVARLIKAAGIE